MFHGHLRIFRYNSTSSIVIPKDRTTTTTFLIPTINRFFKFIIFNSCNLKRDEDHIPAETYSLLKKKYIIELVLTSHCLIRCFSFMQLI